MKSIHCWDDIRPFGVVPLTGEACGLSYRILCDVTARGKRTLEKALGIAQLGPHENWNHGNADDPHVGSVMLAPDLLPFIGVFALLSLASYDSRDPSWANSIEAGHGGCPDTYRLPHSRTAGHGSSTAIAR